MMQSNNTISAAARAVEPNPRLVMAVVAMGVIVGALLSPGPAVASGKHLVNADALAPAVLAAGR